VQLDSTRKSPLFSTDLPHIAPSTVLGNEITQTVDIKFEMWSVRSLYRAGVLSRDKLDLVGVQEVRWEGSGTTPAEEYTFCVERGMRTMNWVQGFLYIRESYQQLRVLSLLMMGCHT
jgi:hypothetical protein